MMPFAYSYTMPDSAELEGGHGESEHAEHGGHSGDAFQSAVDEVRHYAPLGILAGAGTLLLNFIPAVRTSWQKAAIFAASVTGLSLVIAAGLGVAKASHGSEGHGESSGH